MSYAVSSNPEKYAGIKGITDKMEGLLPGERFRVRPESAIHSSKIKYLLYEWMNKTRTKPFFTLRTIPGSWDFHVVRIGVPEARIVEDDDFDYETRQKLNELVLLDNLDDVRAVLGQALAQGKTTGSEIDQLIKEWKKIRE